MSDAPVAGNGPPTPVISTEPSDATLVEATSESAPHVVPDSTKQPVEHLLTFPPFPEIPPGVRIIPFSQFNESGIQLFCDEDGDEVDGHGRPTVPLKRGHAADVRKTQGKKKKKKIKSGDAAEEDDADEADEDEEAVIGAAGLAQPSIKKKKRKGKNKKLMSEKDMETLDPVNKAREKRKHQMAMFAKVEWFKQWAAGDDLRVGKKGYDPNSSAIDRMHIAATEYRLGRVWPPRRTQVHYLWEQFRLYAGLLGSPPVWERTDRPPEEDDEELIVDDPAEPVDEEPQNTGTKVKKQYDDNLAHYSDESEEFDEEPEDLDGSNAEDANDASNDPKKPVRTKAKRVPPRTPYGLYNVEPIPLKSDDEVNLLLKVAGERRDAKLHRFIIDPENSVRVFLSWYMRQEGFVFTPSFMVDFPHLVSFFLKFLLRSKVIPESERSLKRAIAVAETAIDEMPRVFKICKLLPEKVGLGCQAIWGQRWEEEWLAELKAKYATATVPEGKTLEDLREFEEQLKAENVEFLPANPDDLGPPSTGLTELAGAKLEDEDEGEELSAVNVITQSVTIEVLDETLTATSVPGDQKTTYSDKPQPESAAFIEEIFDDAVVVPVSAEATPQAPKVSAEEVSEKNAILGPTTNEIAVNAEGDRALEQTPPQDVGQSDVPPVSNRQVDAAGPINPVAPVTAHGYESEEEVNDWTMEGGPRKLTEEERAVKRKQIYEAWGPSANQPLTELLGMSVFPMRFEAGGKGASRSIGVVERSIRKVHSIIPAGQVEKGKWRGVEEDLVTNLARVILTPWTDWDDGGVAPEYLKPRVQQASIPAPTSTEDGDARSEQPNRNTTRYSHDPLQDDITVLIEPEIAGLMRLGMAFAGTWVQLIPLREYSSFAGGRGRGRGRGRGGRGARGSGRGGAPSANTDQRTDNGDEGCTILTAGASSRYDEDGLGVPPSTGTHPGGRGRGRGRGRGGLSHHGTGTDDSQQKESTFWYIEEVYLGVPSYWSPGEEDPPIELADLGLDEVDIN